MSGYRLLTIEFIFPGETLDVSHLLRANSFHESITLCTDEMKSVVNTCSFSLTFDRELYLKIQREREKIGITVTDVYSWEKVFTGYLDPVLSTSIFSQDDMDDLLFEAVDTSIDLDVLIPVDLAYPDTVSGDAYKLYDPADLPNSLLYHLLVLAGWSERIDAEAPSLEQEVLNVTVMAEEMTWRELLDTLLYEHLHILDTTPDGRITWRPWAMSQVVSTGSVVDDDLMSNPPLRPERRYIPEDGVCVIYAKTSILENVRLWEGSLPIGDSDGEYPGYPGEPIAAGDYWPEDSDVQDVWMDYSKEWLDIPYLAGSSRLKNNDLSLVATSGHQIKDLKDPGVTVDLSEFNSKRARLRYRNTSAEIQELYYSRIYGNALVRTEVLRNTLPITAKMPIEYVTRFIFSSASANALTNALWGLNLYGGMAYSFSTAKLFTPGDIVTLSHAGLDLHTTVLIAARSRNLGENEVCAYQAIAVSELSETAIGVSGSRSGRSFRLSQPIKTLMQYSDTPDGPWHYDVSGSDYYFRSSTDGGVTWSSAVLFRGADGSPGSDGQSLHTWVAYADSADGSGISLSPAGKAYIGYCYNQATSIVDISTPSVFTWQQYIDNFVTSDLQVTQDGAIRSGYTAGGLPPSSGKGFYLHASGIFKAKDGEFTGTFRSGEGADANARFAAKETVGVGPVSHSGGTQNDLLLIAEGDVAGQFEIEIDQINIEHTKQVEHVYAIGDPGPGGGYICYDKGSWLDGWRYLEAYPYQGSLKRHSSASSACDGFSINGKDDWFLPYNSDLQKIYDNRNVADFETLLNLIEWPLWSNSISSLGYYFALLPSGSFDDYNESITLAYIPVRRVITVPYDTVPYYQDRFRWRVDSGSWQPSQEIVSSQTYSLGYGGLVISFGSPSGHTVGELWSFTQDSLFGLSIRDSDGEEYLRASNGVVTIKQVSSPDGSFSSLSAGIYKGGILYGSVTMSRETRVAVATGLEGVWRVHQAYNENNDTDMWGTHGYQDGGTLYIHNTASFTVSFDWWAIRVA